MMFFRRFDQSFCGCGVWLSLVLSLSLISTTATHAQGEQYRLGPGDRVRVTVFGHEDLSGEFDIDGEGRLSLPLVQYVNASGLLPDELEQAITGRLSPNYLKDPKISVELLSYRPFYILGEVKNPGSYPYVSGMTVITAVAIAGGYTYRANQRKIKVIRAADVQKSELPTTEITPIRPGDVIKVPERRF